MWRTRPDADRGFATPVEMMLLLTAALAVLVFLGFLGRLHAAGVQVGSVAQAAARAASQEGASTTATAAAERLVAGSALVQRCATAPTTSLTWTASPAGTWQGGSVTVTVRCALANRGLAGVWMPGARTVSVSDTQPIDRYQR